MFRSGEQEDRTMFAGDDEEEIDVMNADETIIEPVDEDDDQFQPENIFMMGGAEDYDEEGMQFQEDVQFIGQYDENGVLDNADAYNAHYLDDEFAARAEEQEFLKRELIESIEPMSTEKRLELYPEMKQLPPFNRLKKGKKKKIDPKDGPVAALLYINGFGDVNPKEQTAEQLQEAKKFMTLSRLVPETKKPEEEPVVRKVARPRPKVTQEPVKPQVVHLTPLPDRYFVKRLSMSPEQAGFVSECLSCTICHFMVRHKSLLDNHTEKHRKTGRMEVLNPRAGLVCPVKNCSLRSDTIATVIKHLKVAHNLADFVFERIVFKDMEEFVRWKNELERLTVSRYCRTSGKRNMYSKSIYYQCHHSGGLPPSRMEKSRERQSKKLGKTCTAFFHVRENDDGSVLLRGCTKHSGHDADVRHLPLTEEIKMEIASLLVEGYDENYIVDKMRALSDVKNRRYFIQSYEVRNVAVKIERYKEDYKRKQKNNEPLPNLTEILTGRQSNAPYYPHTRAKLACSRFPAVETAEYVSQSSPPYEEPAYFEEPQETVEQVTEEVVVEEGQFNVPTTSGPSAEVFLEKTPIKSVPSKVKLNTRKGVPRKRKLADDEKLAEVKVEKDATPAPSRFSSRLEEKKMKVVKEEIIDVVGDEDAKGASK